MRESSHNPTRIDRRHAAATCHFMPEFRKFGARENPHLTIPATTSQHDTHPPHLPGTLPATRSAIRPPEPTKNLLTCDDGSLEKI
ncbi:MAG: hypothetical protein WCB73_10390 [Pseudonocardiaceae bacterium]